jgi:hypothetical protein
LEAVEMVAVEAKVEMAAATAALVAVEAKVKAVVATAALAAKAAALAVEALEAKPAG